MSGHSHWAGIKHKKAKADAQRGKLFSRLTRQITLAARHGGEIDTNPQLRQAVEDAKEANMPQENIIRAIKKGTGELPGANLEFQSYEGYGPGGVAFVVEVITDNKNRTLAEIKHIFSKHGGSLGAPGCAVRLFKKKGIIGIETEGISEEELMELAIGVGAEDFKIEGDQYTLITSAGDLNRIKEDLQKQGFNIAFAEITMVAENTVRVEGKKAEKILQIMEAIEEHPDVQNVYANFDVPDEIMEKVS